MTHDGNGCLSGEAPQWFPGQFVERKGYECACYKVQSVTWTEKKGCTKISYYLWQISSFYEYKKSLHSVLPY